MVACHPSQDPKTVNENQHHAMVTHWVKNTVINVGIFNNTTNIKKDSKRNPCGDINSM